MSVEVGLEGEETDIEKKDDIGDMADTAQKAKPVQ